MYSNQSIWPEHFTLLTFDQIDSTNDEAKRLARQNLSNDFVIWSKVQTAGRGRYGKKWISNAGNLFVSILLNNKINLKIAGQIVFVAAVALANSIEKLTGREIKLKWPNDLLIDGKKCAGILVESSIVANKLEWIVVGIGVNINSFPDNVDFKATSLYNSNIIIKDDVLLDEFLNSFVYFYQDWLKNGFNPIRESWLVRAYNLGKDIIVRKPDETVSGIFKGLDKDGLLIINVDKDKELLVSTGEVFFNL